MHEQIIMDRGGDTRHTFDPADEAAVRRARERFKALTSKGYRAVALGKEGQPGSLLRDFDATAEQTLFIPQLQGG
jgi:hypothetical protein